MNTLAFGSMLIALLAWFSMRFILKIPALRRTMWPVWLLHLLSMALAVAALLVSGHPILSPELVCALIAVASFILFAIIFLALLRIPSANGRPEVGHPFPDFKVKTMGGVEMSIHALLNRGPTLVVFFRGFWCLSCTDELIGLAPVRAELQKHGGDILAISADRIEVLLRGLKRLHNLPCSVVCDPGANAVTALNLLQSNMAKFGKKVAIPSNILVDENGNVRWTRYADIVMDRPDPRLVMQKVLDLKM